MLGLFAFALVAAGYFYWGAAPARGLAFAAVVDDGTLKRDSYFAALANEMED